MDQTERPNETGGTEVALSDNSVVSPTFTSLDSPNVLTFTLVVTDSFGLVSAADGVTVTVFEPAEFNIYLPLIQQNARSGKIQKISISGMQKN